MYSLIPTGLGLSRTMEFALRKLHSRLSEKPYRDSHKSDGIGNIGATLRSGVQIN